MIRQLIDLFKSSQRFAHLFSLTDRELALRGYDRAALARSFVQAQAHG